MALALTGCATADLQVGRASDMVAAGRAATDASRSVVTETFESHRRLIAELAALDPACGLPYPRIALGANAGRCVDAGTDKGTTLYGPPQRQATLAFATIDAIVAYLDAVDAVVTRKPVDIAAKLEDARANLEAAVGGVNSIVGTEFELPVTADQISSANKMLGVISELLTVTKKVHDLKLVEADLDSGRYNSSIADLRALNMIWPEAQRVALDGEVSIVEGMRGSQALLLRKLCPKPADAACPPGRITAAARADFRTSADQALALIQRKARLVELEKRLGALLTAFETAHANYRKLLFDPANATLTDKERKAKAQIVRERLSAAMAGVADIAKVLI